MKKIRELKFEELTTKQKLGIVHTPLIHEGIEPDKLDYIIERIKECAIGIVWVQWRENKKFIPFYENAIKRIREAADYPIVIVTDAESGMGEYVIGKHGALGTADSEELAYAFGKATATVARERGYDLVCNPILDIKDNGWVRSLGSDKYKIARLAVAEARGMHDAGILTMAKHYPSAKRDKEVDTHIVEAVSSQSEEELISECLYSYTELLREGLLDSIMPGHTKMLKIDPDAPTSMSKKCLDIIRRLGFDGVSMTDALDMTAIRSKYGRKECVGIALEAGNDVPLYYDLQPDVTQEALYECYEKGIISDGALDTAVRRILELQHKAYINRTSDFAPLSDKEKAQAKSINKAGIFAVLDEGTPLSIDRNGKYFFALMIKNEAFSGMDDVAVVDSFSNGWHYPSKITDKILELFPNSRVEMFCQFPTPLQNHKISNASLGYDDVIMITFTEYAAYAGPEHITRRACALIEGMQHTGRIGTLIHFGNPKVCEELPHIPRRIFGGVSADATLGCIEVLAGELSANGTPNYELNLQ